MGSDFGVYANKQPFGIFSVKWQWIMQTLDRTGHPWYIS